MDGLGISPSPGGGASLSSAVIDPTNGAVPADFQGPFVRRFNRTVFLSDHIPSFTSIAQVDAWAAANPSLVDLYNTRLQALADTAMELRAEWRKFYPVKYLRTKSGGRLIGEGRSDGGLVRSGPKPDGNTLGVLSTPVGGTDNFRMENIGIWGRRSLYPGGTQYGCVWSATTFNYFLRNFKAVNCGFYDAGFGVAIYGNEYQQSRDITLEECECDDVDGNGLALNLWLYRAYIKGCRVTRFARGMEGVGIVGGRWCDLFDIINSFVEGDGLEIGPGAHNFSFDNFKRCICTGNHSTKNLGFGFEIGIGDDIVFTGNQAKGGGSRALFALSGADNARMTSDRIICNNNQATDATNAQGFYVFVTGATGRRRHRRVIMEGNEAIRCLIGFQVEDTETLIFRGNIASECIRYGNYFKDVAEVVGGQNIIELTNVAPQTVSVTSLSCSGNLATAVAPSHGFATGDRVRIAGATNYPEWWNGEDIITVTDANTFTFQQRVANIAAATGTLTATRLVHQITSLTSSGSVATAVSANHGLATNDLVTIEDAVAARYNGTKTATVLDADTFTYPIVAGQVSPAGGSPRFIKALNIANGYCGSHRVWTNTPNDKRKVRLDNDRFILNGYRGINDVGQNAFQGFVDGWLYIPAARAAPRLENLHTGILTNYPDTVAFGFLGGKAAFVSNNGGVIQYTTIDVMTAAVATSTSTP